MKSLRFLLLLLATVNLFAQKLEYSTILIPAELKENANAVVRLERTNILITSRSSVSIKTYRAVTVLNEYGLKLMEASESRPVKSISATVYDGLGNEIKKIKRKDFREVAVSEGSIISDNKLTYLEYTPTQYPFTIVYESEVGDSNTAFLPDWYPIGRSLMSVQQSEVTVTYPPALGFKYKENNFENRAIAKEEKAGSISFTVSNLHALKDEQYSPSLNKLVPYVLFGVDKFNLEGVEGEATSWQNFGLWMQNELLSGRAELPEETKSKIKSIVGDEKDPLKKARIVYDYVQGKTRYVSIQLGIGGWKPMKAGDVDRLGYGDCKALTNYTKALLETVGVPSYYCIIYGENGKTDLEKDFVSMQGNHATLAIPIGNELHWVECTSQTAPFDFQANFTDDRLALVVKPEGGQLVRTSVYKEKDNLQFSTGQYTIAPDGSISGDIEIKSRGTQYRSREGLDRESAEDRNTYYKRYFSQINNLQLTAVKVNNDREKPEFAEKISVNAPGYCSIANNRLMFAVNAFNPYNAVPQRYRTRNNPFEISRGFLDEDEITITLPDGYTLEAKPDNVELKETYGTYKAEYTIIDKNHLKYKRSLLLNDG
ncbi:MAG: DUF3857 domain-containing protein, partial [Flavobacterium sp.]